MPQKTYMYDTQWNQLINAINTGDSSAVVTALNTIKNSLDNITNAINNQSITLDLSNINSDNVRNLSSVTGGNITNAFNNLNLTLSIMLSRTRNNITSRLSNLSTAVSEQNLAKYGYKIGDYFTGASGYTYILSDYNTFKGTATPYCLTQNHLGIVVDTHKTSQWHTENASNVGYNGSTLHTFLKGTVMDNIKSDFITLFGGSTGLEHLLFHNKLLTTAFANWGWQIGQYISALTCTQIDAGSQWTANGYQEGEASKSLELFRKYKWTEIFGNEYFWLRNLSNYSTSGSSACSARDLSHLIGDDRVTSSFFAVGLINFY